MTADDKNPLLAYALEQMEYFKNECVRIHDRRPLEDYKQLVDTLFFVVLKLETIEHDVAAAKLDGEFEQALKEAKDAWKGIWSKFHERRISARQTQLEFSSNQQEVHAHLAALEKSYSESAGEYPELDANFRAIVDSFRQLNEIGAPLRKGWKRSPWLFLWSDLGIYSVYVRYFVAKLGFLLYRHALILVGAVLILGLLYSQTFKFLADVVSGLAPQDKWIAGVIILTGYIVKKYYIDSKFKKWQIRLESKRLRQLAYHVHVLRTMALAFRTRALPSH